MGKNDKKTKKGQSRGGGGKSRHRHMQIRTSEDIAADNEVKEEEEESNNSDEEVKRKKPLGLFMWEFGQNDPKRDSGSKLKRLGYAKLLKIGQTFNGVVLSSEATVFVSPDDRHIVEKYGIAGINCSWNRLEEIPFNTMGKSRNHRLLPLLFAANTVNYGRPMKLNTAEAMAACLYIAGLAEEARTILEPFSYGEEFLRLNHEALEAYSMSKSSEEVARINQHYLDSAKERKLEKEATKEKNREGCKTDNSYMADMDLPPMDSDEDDAEDIAME